MGVVNVTPDSFSDGGEFLDADAAIAHGRELAARGRGRSSTSAASRRARAPSRCREEEELRRVHAGDRGARARGDAADLDRHVEGGGRARRRSTPARRFVNDVTRACAATPRWPALVAERGVRVLPHAHARRAAHDAGRPALRRRRRRRQGVPRGARWRSPCARGSPRSGSRLDPGIGFGKTLEHNLELLRRLDEIVALGRPVVIGTSRKSFLGRLTGRDDPSASAWRARSPRTCSRSSAGRRVFRVHDVAATARCAGGGGCYVCGAMDRRGRRRRRDD